MSAIEIKLRYQRPRSLSDPFHDHTPDHLGALLSKSDRDLRWHDFQCVLGPFLPAGTYEESAYFLPLAFDYLLAHDDEALDLVTSLVWFASEYAPQLERDGALDAVREALRSCFGRWSGQFIIHHFDQDACHAKGWGLYRDDVQHSETVMETANDLIRFRVHRDIAIAFFADLAAAESDPIKSAWFLESVRARLSNVVYRPPKHPDIRKLLDDDELAAKHAAVVRHTYPGFDPAATYWRDTFTAARSTRIPPRSVRPPGLSGFSRWCACGSMILESLTLSVTRASWAGQMANEANRRRIDVRADLVVLDRGHW